TAQQDDDLAVPTNESRRRPSWTPAAMIWGLRGLQALRASKLAQPTERLNLELADPLAAEGKPRRDLRQRVLAAVLEPIPCAHDAGRPVVEVAEQARDAGPLHRRDHDVLGRRRVVVGHQVTEARVTVVADRGVQRNGVLRPTLELDNAVRRNTERVRDLCDLGIGAELTGELTNHVAHAVHVLDEVNRKSYRALLLRDRAADRLADPPRRVRRELEATLVVELLDGADQTRVALLDQVEHRHPGAYGTTRDGDHQARGCSDAHALGRS